MGRPCFNKVEVTDEIGKVASACPVCEHTMLVHGGPHNPALESCALCELEKLIVKVRGIQEVNQLWDGS